MDKSSETLKIVRDILLSDWDPLRLQELPVEYLLSNQDEYDRYAEVLAEMVTSSCEQEAIEDYLFDVQVHKMGQKPDRTRAAAAALKLFSLKQNIQSQF